MSSRKIQGVVFDMNGTLVDDIPYHYEAWRSLAEELGVVLSREDFQSFNGLKNEDILPKLVGPGVSAERAAQLIERKEETYRAKYRPHLALVPGARELFVRLRAGSVRVAIASSAPPENRAMVIDGLQLRDYVDVVVAAEHLPGKPAPDVFLEAARLLGVAPSDCLAFEDAVSGVQAAAGAGMLVGAVTTNNPAQTLIDAGASFAVRDFTGLPEDVVSRLP
jgi:beta-phosphoglucomutase